MVNRCPRPDPFPLDLPQRFRTKENEYELLKSDLNESLDSLEQMRLTINNHEEELKDAEEGYKALAQQESLVSNMAGEIATVKTSRQEKEHELRETEAGYQKKLAKNEELVSNLTGEITNVRSTLKNNEQERVHMKDRIATLETKKAQSDKIKAILDDQIKVVHELDEQRFAKKFAPRMSIPDSPRTATYWSNMQTLTNDLYGDIL